MKIAYLLDSSISKADNDNILEQEDCFFIPIHIVIDGQDYLDDEKLNRKEIIEQIKNAESVSTSQPSVGEVETLLDQIIAAGYDVLVTSLIGSGLSGTQNVVYVGALSKKIAVVNLDSRGVGPMQVKAVKMFKEEIGKGGSLLDVQAKVQHMLDVSNCYAIVDDLSYLKRGGRITASSALVGSLLKVKPIVKTNKKLFGKVENVAKVRTRKKAYAEMVKLAFMDIDLDEYNIIIGSFDADEYALELKDYIESNFSTVVDIMDLCFAIGVHTGPNTIALFSVRK